MKNSNQVPIAPLVNLDFNKFIEAKSKVLDEQLKRFSARLISETENEIKVQNQKLKVKPLNKAVPEEAEALTREMREIDFKCWIELTVAPRWGLIPGYASRQWFSSRS